jgi:hypothetical protein
MSIALRMAAVRLASWGACRRQDPELFFPSAHRALLCGRRRRQRPSARGARYGSTALALRSKRDRTPGFGAAPARKSVGRSGQ